MYSEIKGISIALNITNRHLFEGFNRVLEMDQKGFLAWLVKEQNQLDKVIRENSTRVWEIFLANESKYCHESSGSVLSRRKAKLQKVRKI